MEDIQKKAFITVAVLFCFLGLAYTSLYFYGFHVSICVPQKLEPVVDSLVGEAPGTRSFSESSFNVFQYPQLAILLVKISLNGDQPLPPHCHLRRGFHYQHLHPSLLHHLPEKKYFCQGQLVDCTVIVHFTRNHI